MLDRLYYTFVTWVRATRLRRVCFIVATALALIGAFAFFGLTAKIPLFFLLVPIIIAYASAYVLLASLAQALRVARKRHPVLDFIALSTNAASYVTVLIFLTVFTWSTLGPQLSPESASLVGLVVTCLSMLIGVVGLALGFASGKSYQRLAETAVEDLEEPELFPRLIDYLTSSDSRPTDRITIMNRTSFLTGFWLDIFGARGYRWEDFNIELYNCLRAAGHRERFVFHLYAPAVVASKNPDQDYEAALTSLAEITCNGLLESRDNTYRALNGRFRNVVKLCRDTHHGQALSCENCPKFNDCADLATLKNNLLLAYHYATYRFLEMLETVAGSVVLIGVQGFTYPYRFQIIIDPRFVRSRRVVDVNITERGLGTGSAPIYALRVGAIAKRALDDIENDPNKSSMDVDVLKNYHMIQYQKRLGVAYDNEDQIVMKRELTF